jgi:hypothetical protein
MQIGLKAGADFSAADVLAAGNLSGIVVKASINGYVFGGITYRVDPTLKTPPVEVLPSAGSSGDCNKNAAKLIECLKLPAGEIKSVCVKKVTVEIEFKDCDC